MTVAGDRVRESELSIDEMAVADGVILSDEWLHNSVHNWMITDQMNFAPQNIWPIDEVTLHSTDIVPHCLSWDDLNIWCHWKLDLNNICLNAHKYKLTKIIFIWCDPSDGIHCYDSVLVQLVEVLKVQYCGHLICNCRVNNIEQYVLLRLDWGQWYQIFYHWIFHTGQSWLKDHYKTKYIINL